VSTTAASFALSITQSHPRCKLSKLFVRLWGVGADYTLSNAAAVYFVLLYRVWRHPDPSQKRFARELGSEEVGLKRATRERENLMEEIPALSSLHIHFTAYESQC